MYALRCILFWLEKFILSRDEICGFENSLKTDINFLST